MGGMGTCALAPKHAQSVTTHPCLWPFYGQHSTPPPSSMSLFRWVLALSHLIPHPPVTGRRKLALPTMHATDMPPCLPPASSTLSLRPLLARSMLTYMQRE